MAGAGILFSLGVIGHDLATNKFVEAQTVLGHGVTSLVGGMADVAVAEALDSRDVGCCSIGWLLRLGVNGPSSPWGFCIEELETSWIFAPAHYIMLMLLDKFGSRPLCGCGCWFHHQDLSGSYSNGNNFWLCGMWQRLFN